MIRKKYTDVSLFNSYRYETKIRVRGVDLIMDVGYNTRNKLRWVSLVDTMGNIILPRTFLRCNDRSELSFTSNRHNLDYYITLNPKSSLKSFGESYDYKDWKDDFVLTFAGYTYKEVEYMQAHTRKITVGN